MVWEVGSREEVISAGTARNSRAVNEPILVFPKEQEGIRNPNKTYLSGQSL
jgi:hypothetical protein